MHRRLLLSNFMLVLALSVGSSVALAGGRELPRTRRRVRRTAGCGSPGQVPELLRRRERSASTALEAGRWSGPSGDGNRPRLRAARKSKRRVGSQRDRFHAEQPAVHRWLRLRWSSTVPGCPPSSSSLMLWVIPTSSSFADGNGVHASVTFGLNSCQKSATITQRSRENGRRLVAVSAATRPIVTSITYGVGSKTLVRCRRGEAPGGIHKGEGNGTCCE